VVLLVHANVSCCLRQVPHPCDLLCLIGLPTALLFVCACCARMGHYMQMQPAATNSCSPQSLNQHDASFWTSQMHFCCIFALPASSAKGVPCSSQMQPPYLQIFQIIHCHRKHLVFPQLIAGATLQAVSRSNLQLISVACILVAAKHEEERHPSVQDFTSIADNCFLAGDLLKMESVVLQSLAFRINAPTSCTFLSMFQQGINLSPKAHAMASYFTVH